MSNPYHGLNPLPRDWQRRKRAVFSRDGWRCVECERYKRPLHCDHITPRAEGGGDELDNLQTLCQDCHNKKTAAENRAREGLPPDDVDGLAEWADFTRRRVRRAF